MHISSTASFIESLKTSNVNKSHIAKDDSGRFVAVSKDISEQGINKQNLQRLNNQQIAVFAQECFKSIVETSGIRLDARLNTLEYLKNSIGKHSSRIYESKPWWAKVMAFFGFRSSAENRLTECVNNILKQQDVYRTDLKKTPEELKESDVIRLQQPHFLLKDCYHKVLDSTTLSFPLERMLTREASLAFIQELKAFNQRKGTPDSEKKLISQLVKELEAAYDLEIFYRSKNWGDPAKSSEKVGNFVKQIKALNPDPQKGFNRTDKVIIHGGCNGHAVLYQIEKEKDSTFSFTIINTGEGRKLYGKDILGRNTFRDIKYTRIKEDAFTTEFIASLVVRMTYENMDKVLKLIDRHFGAKKRIAKDQGRIHKQQKHETCASKSIASWLKGEMSFKVGREFKFFMTARKIEAVKVLNSSSDLDFEKISQSKSFKEDKKLNLSGADIKKLTVDMIEEGKKVLTKRAGKAGKLKERSVENGVR